MTVSTSVVKHLYSGDGADKTFDFSFRILESANLLVQLKDNATGALTTQTLTTHYTVGGIGNAVGRTNYSSGTVTFVTAPASTKTVVIGLNVEILQETDYVENDVFPAEAHEEALDKLTMIAQQTDEEVSRSLKFDAGTTIDGTITVGTDQALKYLRVNSAADALEFVAVTAVGGGIQGVVQDTSPVLGGDLEVDGYDIVGPVNITGATTMGGLVTANANLDVKNGATGGATIKAYEDSDNGTNYVGLKAPDSLSASTTYTLPSADGSSGQYLQTNGSATLSFTTVTQVSAATQADQETGTSTTTYVSPGMQQYHTSAAKVWASVTVSGGVPTLVGSHNLTSITDGGVGLITYTFSVDFSTTNYAELHNGRVTAAGQFFSGASVHSTADCNAVSYVSTTPTDPIRWYFAAFGDQ